MLLIMHLKQNIKLSQFLDYQRAISLDSLRGVLVSLIVVSHAASWFGYLQSGRWALPPSVALTYMAQASVAMLFMLTGYLFTSKLLQSRHQGMDWIGLFTGRFLRLVPAYMLSVVLLFTITLVTGLWGHGVHAATPAGAYLAWLLFAVPGTPSLHGVQDTVQVMAGATWTLAYAWIFYFSLPVLAWFFRVRTSGVLALVGAAMACLIASLIPHYKIIYAMLALGGLCAVLVRWDGLRHALVHPACAVLAWLCVLLATWVSPSTAYSAIPLLLLGVVFLIIACGNSLGGLLHLQACQTWGRCSYSLYLLHGPLLYIALKLVSAFTHWPLDEVWGFGCLVLLLAPCLVGVSLASYHWIEAPALGQQDAFSRRVKVLLRRW